MSAVRPFAASTTTAATKVTGTMSLHLGLVALAMFSASVLFVRGAQSFVFGQCDRRHTNLTAQECVGRVILDTLTKVTEDPENFLRTNVSTAYEPNYRGGVGKYIFSS